MNDPIIDPSSIRKRLAATAGDEYWRSLDELADTPEFRQLLHQDYPRLEAALNVGMDRRQFLKLLGASLALAGLTACGGAPVEKIVPYVHQPEGIIPGKPLYFASAMPLGGYATGVLVENHMGRPTKVEGNPDHPASLGATDVFAQASILSLYDPDRSQAVTFNGQIRTYENFLEAMRQALEKQRTTQGSGIRILTETITSPTFTDQMRSVLAAWPNARWIQYEPATRDNTRAGAHLAFSQYVETTFRLDQADTILSLDADFLIDEPGSLRYAHDFAARRVVTPGQTGMNRLYVVESTPTITGAKADHRLGLRAGAIQGLARAVAAGVGVQGFAAGELSSKIPERWVSALVSDLQAHRGKSLIVVGVNQPPVVHALGHALNAALGNVGKTLVYSEPVEANPTDQVGSLRQLALDLEAGRVDLLLVIGANPVYSAPVDLRFEERLPRAGLRIHSGLYQDETAALCQWHIPQAHYLESWGDARAFDGTITIIQPLIAPLYGGRSMYEMLAAFSENQTSSGHDIVQAYWKQRIGTTGDWNSFWQEALNRGTVPNTTARTLTPLLTTGWAGSLNTPVTSPEPDTFEVNFRTDPSVLDGRFANNGWLQELPKPLTRLTWDNAILVSPATAQRLGLTHDLAGEGGEHGAARTDIVELTYGGQTLRGPIWITPGQPDDAVTLYLGYGRTRAGHVGSGIGYNAYRLRTSAAPWFGTGLRIRKTGERYELASVQQHHMMEGRGLIRSATLQEFIANPKFAQEVDESSASLFPAFKYDGNKWGMTIDTSTCIGCNACVVACQSENNIPVVGKDQVLKSREMHWLRIDTFYKGDVDNPETYFEPVPCMHCENAPCEVVCPVDATVHSSEGLNEMVYNRCVGTRYCSNNCPYKVRRFNFLQYSDWTTESLKPMRNPDVTVRSRGVMEKCTFCVQRIDLARINAEREGRSIRDGEILTACQAACPANAIVFGNLNDPQSRVAQLKADARNYGLLAELNTRPRTTYLAAVRNPNPELEG